MNLPRQILFFFINAFFLLSSVAAQKQLIHAHNDYEKQQPLFHAISQKAAFIEADVFPIEGKLHVAHDKKQVTKSRTLDALYLQPIVNLFSNNSKPVSEDSSYCFALCIDIKENNAEAIKLLIGLLQRHQQYFDRSINKYAVQIIISGDRGDIKNWANLPSYIYFDGRPFEQYDEKTLERIATISDSYQRYKSESELKKVIEQAHALKKPVRFWGAPDNESTWKQFSRLGVDIINTDHPERARKFIDETL